MPAAPVCRKSPVSRPVIVFSHANGFPSGTYRKLLAALAPDIEVRCLDMLGHDSRFPVDDNWGNLAQELLAFIDTLGDGPVYGVGHSMGATVTFFSAHRAPERFAGLVMLDPPIVNGVGALPFQLLKWLGRVDDVTPAGKSARRRTQWPSREAALADLAGKKLFAGWDQDCLRDYVESGTAPVADGVALRYRLETELAVFRTTPSNPWRYLRPLRVPGLLVTGRDSDVAMPDHMRRLYRRHGLAYRQVDGGHLFPLEHPLETAQLLRAQVLQWEQARHG